MGGGGLKGWRGGSSSVKVDDGNSKRLVIQKGHHPLQTVQTNMNYKPSVLLCRPLSDADTGMSALLGSVHSPRFDQRTVPLHTETVSC